MSKINKIIGATELQGRFRAVLEEVVHRKTPSAPTRGGRPEAVMIPCDRHLKFAQADEADVLDGFDRVRERMAAANARYSDKEVETDLIEATRTVRKRR